MISKDTNNRVYNFGIAEGKELVEAYFKGEDFFDMALDGFNKKESARLESQSLDELVKFIRNFVDGIEDGVKSQCHKEAAAYVKWMRDNE